MLGISFSGNLNRKQYWLRLILLFILSSIIFGGFFALYQPQVVKMFQKLVAVETLEERQNNPETLNEREKLEKMIEDKDRLNPESKKAIDTFIEKSKTMSSDDLANIIKADDQARKDPIYLIVHVLFLLYIVYMILAYFSFYVRRGHDLQRSGWLTVLMACIPFVNLIYCYVYLGFFPGVKK